MLVALMLIPATIALAERQSNAPVRGQEKVAVCHVDGQGNFSAISIADPALDAHLAHSDGQPGVLIPGMPDYNFDANCAPVLSNPVDVCNLQEDGSYSLLTIAASQLDAYLTNGDAQPGEQVRMQNPIYTNQYYYGVLDANCTPVLDVCQWAEEDYRYNKTTVALADLVAYTAGELSWPPTALSLAATPPYPAPFSLKNFDIDCNILVDPCTVEVQAACSATGGYCISGSATCIAPPDEKF